MNFGVATADITPPPGVTLWGYDPRPAESLDHPLRAEALACGGENGGWILIGADIGAFAEPFAGRVRADISRRTGLPVAAVMLTATHTHSGPHVTDALRCERSGAEADYFKILRAKLADTAERAWRARAPGRLLHGHAIAPELASNRRIRKTDGAWGNEWSDPAGTHDGYYDPAVEMAGIRRPDGTLDVLLVNFGCHPVCFGSRSRAISGDYVSYLKDALEAGGDARTVIFTVAAHGNIDPRVCVQTDPAVVRTTGENLAEIVRRALPGLTPVQGAKAAAVSEPWHFKTTWELTGRAAIYFPHAARGASVRTSISVLAAGSLALLGLPGETVSEYREKLGAHSPFRHTLPISLANDFIGYLATDEIMAQGAYEAKLCPLNPIEPELKQRAEAALRRARAAIGEIE